MSLRRGLAQPFHRAASMIAARRWSLPLAALLAHAWLIGLGLYGNGNPMVDVLGNYSPWVSEIATRGGWFGLTVPWVYPYPAFVPLLVAGQLVPGHYLAGWLVLIVTTNLVALGSFLALSRNVTAAWYWITAIVLLGPVAVSRLDSFSIALAIVGIAALAPHRSRGAGAAWASAWLTLAAWIKIWPVALVGALCVSSRRRVRVMAGAAGVTVVAAGLALVLGGGANLFSFATLQRERGIEVGSPVATFWLWQAVAGVPGAGVEYDHDVQAFQVQGVGASAVARLTSVAMLGALAISFGAAALAARRGAAASQLLATAALAGVLDLVFFNKVGSPQYVGWLVVAVMLGFVVDASQWRTPATAVLVLAALTGLTYPTLFESILAFQPLAIAVLTFRHVILCGLLVWANVRIFRIAAAS